MKLCRNHSQSQPGTPSGFMTVRGYRQVEGSFDEENVFILLSKTASENEY